MKQSFLLYCLCLIILLSALPAFAAELPAAYIDTAVLFTSQDLLPALDSADAVSIELDGNTAHCSDSSVSILTNTVTITKDGIYRISGTLNDGQLVVDAENSSTVQLILNGANISSSFSAPIEIRKAEQVILTLAVGTQNTLVNSGSFPDDENTDAVIFSKSDLTLNGSGKLTIQAANGHGIVSKKSLKICDSSITIDAEVNGMSGKDYAAICNADLTIRANSDGIRAKDKDETSRGYLCISGTNLRIECGGNGINATGNLQLEGGSYEIITGSGSENGSMKASDAASLFGGRGGYPMENADLKTDTSDSAKGMKAGGSILISGGSFQLDCADDAIHANEGVCITAGEFFIRTADDAIHAGKELLIQNGNFTIPYCYEGLEGETVTIDNGTFDIVSTDDGINAAGGSGSSEGWGWNSGNSNASVTINGGNITIVSDGDSIDSNGTITLNGGTLNLTCNGYGNTAIDYETEFSNNGAHIITNDGSENGGGMMHGMGGRGPFGGNDFGGHRQPPEGMDQRPEGFNPDGRFPAPPDNRQDFPRSK